jgi:hypothetical protein
MPTNEFTFPATGGGFSLAMSFDVTGNDVVATGFASGSCAPPSPPFVIAAFSFGATVSGTIAADGSFTLQSPGNVPVDSLSIQGKIPQANGDPFLGSYTASFNSPTGKCMASYSGMFTATSFPPVSGVYTGTGSTLTTTNGVSSATPIAVQVTLQQGGMVTNPATGVSKPSSIALTGSIRVQGFPCFTTGVTSAIHASRMEGNMVGATFTMDDGSALSLSGALTDSTEAHISGVGFVVTGGKCGTPSPLFVDVRQLDLQS